MRIGIPIKGKTQEAVLSGFIELYLQLKVDGFSGAYGAHGSRT